MFNWTTYDVEIQQVHGPRVPPLSANSQMNKPSVSSLRKGEGCDRTTMVCVVAGLVEGLSPVLISSEFFSSLKSILIAQSS